ncbi:MAG: hypothetical protein HY788_16465 [Deltaproteobacteria bacterium]|nr:hypothetical protein [Deltaproteobacteria bacterium]
MKHHPDTDRPRGQGKAFERVIREDRAGGCALLCALLDTEILFEEKGVPFETLTPLWNLYCPECAPEHEAELLGLSSSSEADACTLAGSEGLERRLTDHLAGRRIRLRRGDLTLAELLDDFTERCRRDLGIAIDDRSATWGGRCFSASGRCHHVLIRPRPVLIRAHPLAFILLLSPLPVSGIHPIIDLFVEIPGLRQRLAIVDIENGLKINLTKSDVFVHFERYLRRVHGLRLAVHPELTQGLVDGGIMKLEKG